MVTTSSKGYQNNPDESYAKIETKKLEYSIPYIPVEKRSAILPKHNICSIAPAGESSDNFITGSGTLRIQTSGQPYNDVVTYTQEMLYEPKWAETPLPPDLRPYLPRIRQLLLEGKPNEANALVDEAQKKAGFEKYMKRYSVPRRRTVQTHSLHAQIPPSGAARYPRLFALPGHAERHDYLHVDRCARFFP